MSHKKNIVLNIRISDEQKKIIDIGSQLYGSKTEFMKMLIEIGSIVIRHNCENRNDIITLSQLKKAFLEAK